MEPVALTGSMGVKRHLRIDADDTDFDDLLAELIRAAREAVEHDADVCLLTQSWELTLDSFPSSSDTAIELPKRPAQSVTSISYVDTNGDTQTWDEDEYQVDVSSTVRRGRVRPAYGMDWPTTRDQLGAVRIEFVAGYGDTAADVPRLLKQAMLLWIAASHELPEAVVVLTRAKRAELVPGPQAYWALIRRLRLESA